MGLSKGNPRLTSSYLLSWCLLTSELLVYLKVGNSRHYSMTGLMSQEIWVGVLGPQKNGEFRKKSEVDAWKVYIPLQNSDSVADLEHQASLYFSHNQISTFPRTLK